MGRVTSPEPNTPTTGYWAAAGRHRRRPYQNATWIIAPSGDIVAAATTRNDEIITATIDLDLARTYRTMLNFADFTDR